MATEGSAADELLGLYSEGARALVRHAEDVDWDAPACGRWTAAEVARHVASVAGWYHEWLDRAIAGDAEPPFASPELPRRNDEAIHARAGQDPSETVSEFEEAAEAYAERVADHWELPYGYPLGTVTAGLHAAVAASEWHLHAWDLARTHGCDHRPGDAAALFRATGACVADARGGLAGRVQAGLVRLGASVRPWEQMLRASGRRRGR